MSVASPVISSIDGVTRRIFLAAGVRAYHPIDDIYAEVVNLRRTTEALRPFDMFVAALPIFDKGGGRFTPRALILRLGTRIVPADEDHDLEITGEQLTDDGGSGPDGMDLSLLGSGRRVTVNYAPAEAELITVNSGSGLSTAQADMLIKLWQAAGFDPDNPLFVPNGAGAITIGGTAEIDVTGDCETGHTLTARS